MKEIVVQGMNGEMVVEGDKITVKHTGPLFLGKREVVLDIHSLQAVVYKKAHLLINGFLKLVPKGDNPMLYQTASLHQMGKDEPLFYVLLKIQTHKMQKIFILMLLVV